MSRQRYIFRRNFRWYSSPLAIFILTGMILGGLFVTQEVQRGDIEPMFLATPTATRIAASFEDEAETHFLAGDLDAAIASYQQAILINPGNGQLYADLARILTYSTESQTTEQEKQIRFDQAIEASDKAVELAPDDSTSLAVQAFTKDWYAGFLKYTLYKDEDADRMLTEAEQAISRAITYDETNVLAQVYRGEIMIDQQRWDQAQSSIRAALTAAPDLWEAHRVNALYLENQGYYMDSIQEYEEAAKLAPNMTFLYIRLGMSYRNLANTSSDETQSNELYLLSIENFAKAAAENEQLGIQNPLPYLGIGRAYGQMGEFYAASQNMSKALQYDPYNPEVYAQLGMVYRQARNYEDALLALQCGVIGCTAEVTCELRDCNSDVDPPITIDARPISGQTLVYYYTYASLLAGMYLPRDPVRQTYCDQSLKLIAELRASTFASDPVIVSILNESESMCRTMQVTPTGPQITPSPTATGVYIQTLESGPIRSATPAPEGEE